MILFGKTDKSFKISSIKWYASSHVDEFICIDCQRKHQYLHINWTEDGNILALTSSTSERGLCGFLNQFIQEVIYDLTGKKIEEVIKDEFTRKIISERLSMVKREYKNNQRNKVICEKLGKEKFLSDGSDNPWGNISIKGDLEKAGIELIKEELFACDNCGKGFTDEDIQRKNYLIQYSTTLYCGDITTTVEQIYNILHKTCRNN